MWQRAVWLQEYFRFGEALFLLPWGERYNLPQHPGVHVTHHMMPRTMRVGASGKASELYSGNTQLESRPEHQLAWTYLPCFFSSPPGKGIMSNIDHDHFLLHSVRYSLTEEPGESRWCYDLTVRGLNLGRCNRFPLPQNRPERLWDAKLTTLPHLVLR